MNEEYKSLTPSFRREIQDSIRSQMQELNTCQNNAFVSAQKVGLTALSSLINALPDGYPIPIERR
jgi:hypothetical protein